MVLRNSLKTHDKPRQWDVCTSTDLSLLRCVLCDAIPDSHEHLFFECTFSSKVWVYIRHLVGMDNVHPRLGDIVAYLQPIASKRSATSIIGRLLLAASSYHIWLECNYRTFKQTKRSPEEIHDYIMVTVRLKLPTFKFKNTSRVKGFKLPPSKSYTLFLPPNWSGRLWGREGCSFSSTGHGHCNTGDCGGALYCNGTGGEPPATLAEITLAAEFDFYDVSLVDGYNLPIAIKPFKGTGYCRYVGCVSDLNVMCPVGLQVRSLDDKRRVVACKSACSVFKSPRFCCTGNYGNAFTCKATAYSKIFKVACPRAYSYAYDDATSVATCTSASYLLTFCLHR
nr:hypothetical protein [Tanacetum cinerariifolium]